MTFDLSGLLEEIGRLWSLDCGPGDDGYAHWLGRVGPLADAVAALGRAGVSRGLIADVIASAVDELMHLDNNDDGLASLAGTVCSHLRDNP